MGLGGGPATKRGFDSQALFVIFIIFIISIICLISVFPPLAAYWFLDFLASWLCGFLSSISESVISGFLHLPELVLLVADGR